MLLISLLLRGIVNPGLFVGVISFQKLGYPCRFSVGRTAGSVHWFQVFPGSLALFLSSASLAPAGQHPALARRFGVLAQSHVLGTALSPPHSPAPERCRRQLSLPPAAHLTQEAPAVSPHQALCVGLSVCRCCDSQRATGHPASHQEEDACRSFLCFTVVVNRKRCGITLLSSLQHFSSRRFQY